MGHGGVAKGWWGTQRPTGMKVVVLVSALVFLSASAALASASHHHICPTDKSSVKLIPYETVYFTSSARSVRLRVESVGCINDTRVFHLAGLKVSNQTSQGKTLRWYEFSFINCGNYVVRIGSKIVKLKHLSDKCIHKPITVSVEFPTLLGRKCSQIGRGMEEVEKGKAACRELAGVADTGHRLITNHATNIGKLWDLLDKSKKFDTSDLFFDTSLSGSDKDNGKSRFDTPELFFDGHKESEEPQMPKGFSDDIFLKPPSFNYDDFLPVSPPTQPSINLHDDNYFGNAKRRNYKENAIPIFIGIVAFTVSMCLRFCLCRGKSVVRRVTTVTVIRSRPPNSPDGPQDQQDPPPAYVDVVNENMPPDNPTDDACVEPPPPAYADIAHEVLPPTYSEVEAQSMSSEAAPLADQENATQSSSPPPDPGSGSDDKDSGTARGVLSKYISQQKQFAFKVLEEDE